MSTPAAVSTAATTPSGTPGASTLAPAGGIGAAAGPWGMAAEAGLGIGMSLLQASEQASAARNYQEQQNRAIAEAKRQAGANFMQNISAPTEAYQAAMREGTAQQMQALQAGTEGDVRNLQGIVGRTNEAATDFDFGQRDKMAKDLYDLHMAQAQEQKQSANELAGIGLQEAQGAGLAKQQAEKARVAAQTNAAEAGLRIGAGLDQMQALYKRQNTPNITVAGDVTPYTSKNMDSINNRNNNNYQTSAFNIDQNFLPGLVGFNSRPI
jgi:hypothetical protein